MPTNEPTIFSLLIHCFVIVRFPVMISWLHWERRRHNIDWWHTRRKKKGCNCLVFFWLWVRPWIFFVSLGNNWIYFVRLGWFSLRHCHIYRFYLVDFLFWVDDSVYGFFGFLEGNQEYYVKGVVCDMTQPLSSFFFERWFLGMLIRTWLGLDNRLFMW